MTTGASLGDRARGWFDPALAAVMFIACEVEVVTRVLGDSGHDHWPVAANVIVVGALTVPLAWRRTAPLTSLLLVETSLLVLATLSLADLQTVNFPQLVLFISPYSVAAYAPRTRALWGLGFAVLTCAVTNVVSPSGASSWVFSVGACIASWTTGRILRARRAATDELRRTTDRINAERGGRELLAVAEQRTRIARELQTLIADSVSTMIVQTQTAQGLLRKRPEEADAAMDVIERTGRDALVEMRRILGVLRCTDEQPDLAPQPGVGQLSALVEGARDSGRDLTLRVDGEPGPLPASVDLGIYRLLEDALISLTDSLAPIDVALRFGADAIELQLTMQAVARLDLPTIAMRERVALCQGTVEVELIPGSGERLSFRLPRVFDGALV